MNTILWHDYETWGRDPRQDRPCQFAALRTDEALNPVDDPLECHCEPSGDFLPDPEAVMITGIGPRTARERGLPEREFCARIAAQFLEPGSCVAGYNSLRFDDEVSRHLLYRCFYDPYEREWKNGNSRWDLLDVLRTTWALRPEGIVWPEHEDGAPSFRLEQLTRANGIAHEDAHDALADVHATIAMARLVRERQPRLYDYLYGLRSKHRVLPLLDLAKREPVLHVSGMFPTTRGCLGLVFPLLMHPRNSNGVIVLDLCSDPGPWLALDAATLRDKLYTRREDLPAGENRIALKTIHVNRCPSLAPLTVLNPELIARHGLDLEAMQRHRDAVLAVPDLMARLREVFDNTPDAGPEDPELMLYSGGFFSAHDKRLMAQVQRLPPQHLAGLAGKFQDTRLPELLFRLRARNHPETLDAAEQARWREHCRGRLSGEVAGPGPAWPEFGSKLDVLAPQLGPALTAELRNYGDELAQACGLA